VQKNLFVTCTLRYQGIRAQKAISANLDRMTYSRIYCEKAVVSRRYIPRDIAARCQPAIVAYLAVVTNHGATPNINVVAEANSGMD
jgi:hypothetical protein